MRCLSKYINRTTNGSTIITKTILPTSFNAVRHYAIKDRSSEQQYKYGKLIVEEEEDPKVYPKFLLVFTGYDEASVNTYFNFAKKAAKMTDVYLTKEFRMPAKEAIVKSNIYNEGTSKIVEYKLKQYERVIELSDLTGEKSDIYIEFLQKSLPPGVQIRMELKKWETHADPGHGSLPETTDKLRTKAKSWSKLKK